MAITLQNLFLKKWAIEIAFFKLRMKFLLWLKVLLRGMIWIGMCLWNPCPALLTIGKKQSIVVLLLLLMINEMNMLLLILRSKLYSPTCGHLMNKWMNELNVFDLKMVSNITNNKLLSRFKKPREGLSVVKIQETILQFRVISQQEW